MPKRLTADEEITKCFQSFFPEKFTAFMKDAMGLFELFHEDEDDWIDKAVGEENSLNVRVIRTVYLMSRLAHNHAGMLCCIKTEYPKLWLRMEKMSFEDAHDDNDDGQNENRNDGVSNG